jgi:hypothetical protein
MKELRRESPTIDAAVRKATAALRRVRGSLVAAPQTLSLSLSLALSRSLSLSLSPSLSLSLRLVLVRAISSSLLSTDPLSFECVQNQPGLFPASPPADDGLLLEGEGDEQLAQLAAKQASMEAEMRERLDAMDSKLDRLLASASK